MAACKHCGEHCNGRRILCDSCKRIIHESRYQYQDVDSGTLLASLYNGGQATKYRAPPEERIRHYRKYCAPEAQPEIDLSKYDIDCEKSATLEELARVGYVPKLDRYKIWLKEQGYSFYVARVDGDIIGRVYLVKKRSKI